MAASGTDLPDRPPDRLYRLRPPCLGQVVTATGEDVGVRGGVRKEGKRVGSVGRGCGKGGNGRAGQTRAVAKAVYGGRTGDGHGGQQGGF